MRASGLVFSGRKVREIRLKQMMSQEILASRAKIRQSYLSRIETGKIEEPKAVTLLQLGRALGVGVKCFFEETK